MEKKWRFLIGGVIGVIVVTSIVVPVTIHFLKKDNLSVDDIIIIMNDIDFQKYNFPGDGSESNPYIIENYNITTSEDNAIYISSTSKYFIIRNCHLEANLTGIQIENIAYGTAIITKNICNNHLSTGISVSSSSGASILSNFCYDNSFAGFLLIDCSDIIVANNTENNSFGGIYLSNSNSITLTNNTFTNNSYGIELHYSSNVNLTKNICDNNFYYGISFLYSHNNTLTNNTCNDSFYKGIHIESSINTVLTNNSCENSHDGFYVLGSNNTTMINNTFSNHILYGIRLIDSNNASLLDNAFYNCGLSITHYSLEGYFSHTIENNRVNDKKLGYLVNNASSTISNSIYGQLILINCSDMIISNLEISNTTTCLTLNHCENATLINNICNNSNSGIFLMSSSNSTLINNTCENNWNGIIIYSANNATLNNNTCNNNEHDGISVDNSSNTKLTNNTCNNNHNGMHLWDSKDVTLNENTCYNNVYSGILSTSSDTIIVTSNSINNNGYGLNLGYSDSCLIIFNVFRENTNYAISLNYETDNTIIHHNSFISNNSGGTSQANDEWMNNTWYDSTTNKGNYWSDWIGIGDYNIDGTANTVDSYPLSSPPVI